MESGNPQKRLRFLKGDFAAARRDRKTGNNAAGITIKWQNAYQVRKTAV